MKRLPVLLALLFAAAMCQAQVLFTLYIAKKTGFGV